MGGIRRLDLGEYLGKVNGISIYSKAVDAVKNNPDTLVKQVLKEFFVLKRKTMQKYGNAYTRYIREHP